TSAIVRTPSFIFFFQAEDVIRCGHVTGVQTCALPIFGAKRRIFAATDGQFGCRKNSPFRSDCFNRGHVASFAERSAGAAKDHHRSEERRVGGEGRRGREGVDEKGREMSSRESAVEREN